MQIKLKYCNNINEATIDLHDEYLNIHFAVNGTGKSTIAKAIELKSKNEQLSRLKPFDLDEEPEVEFSKSEVKVLLFNEDFVNTIVFKESEVIQNAFEVFIKSPAFETQKQKLEIQLKDIHIDVSSDEDLNRLLVTGQSVISKIKLTKQDELSKTGLIKSLTTNENIFKLPKSIEKFQPLMEKDYNVEWVGWKNEGANYDDEKICPFCVTNLGSEYEKEKEVFTSSYNKSNVKNIKELFGYFDSMKDYMDESLSKELYQCIRESEDSQETLIWVRRFYDDLDYLVNKIKGVLGFNSFGVNSEDISNLGKKLTELKISPSIPSIIKNARVMAIIGSINKKIDNLLKETEILKRELGQLKALIGSSTKKSVRDINEFLEMSGINYLLEIQHQSEESARAILKYVSRHSDAVEVRDIRSHLSWGERNAFALILFMHYVSSQDCEVIVLDDPISSFDSNKKYAIMNRLFINAKTKKSFYKKTVLMLTHDLQPLIDFIKVKKPSGDYVRAYYLNNENGLLTQSEITESDIKSLLILLEEDSRNEGLNKIHRLISLRKLIEHTFNNPQDNLAYNLISCLLHGESVPSYIDNTPIAPDDIVDGENYIKIFIADFSYDPYISSVFSKPQLVSLYESESNSYFQLQIFRVLIEILKLRDKIDDDPLVKFIDEQFHVENDYIFQLDYKKYDCVPGYIKRKCQEFLEKKNVI